MSSTRRFFGGLRERIPGVDDANRQPPPLQSIYYVPCTVCGMNHTDYRNAYQCRKDDMLKFIYEKLGGTYKKEGS